MAQTLIIVFREVLEAALVIGIVLAACRGVPRRHAWIAGGVAGGVLGAVLVAGFAGEIASAVEGVGQELFDAAILFAAVVMLGWHNIWMSRHGRELAQNAQRLGQEVLAGTRPLYALALVVGIAVLREGSEAVLFLYSIAATSGTSAPGMALGGALGLAAGAGAGAAIYFGLRIIPTRHLFTVTNWLILLLAAGMASQCAFYLVQAGLLPDLGNSLWDTSSLLDENGPLGRLLHVLVGYTARPEGIQLVFYLTTLLGIGLLMRLIGREPPPGRGQEQAARIRTS